MLSQRSRYALKALLHLAGEDNDAPVSIGTIATAANISRKFLEAILLALRRGGFLESKIGREGGYRLSRAPREIAR